MKSLGNQNTEKLVKNMKHTVKDSHYRKDSSKWGCSRTVEPGKLIQMELNMVRNMQERSAKGSWKYMVKAMSMDMVKNIGTTMVSCIRKGCILVLLRCFLLPK